MEARHCPPPGGWTVCGGGGGGGGRGGWSERRAGSGKLPPPFRPLLAGVGPAERSARLGHSRPGRPSAGAARRGLARPLARRVLRRCGPPGTPPHRWQRRPRRPSQASGEGAAAAAVGCQESRAAPGGRTPWLPWTLPSHPHPAPVRPLGPGAGPGGRLRGGLARTGPLGVGVCRPRSPACPGRPPPPAWLLPPAPERPSEPGTRFPAPIPPEKRETFPPGRPSAGRRPHRSALAGPSTWFLRRASESLTPAAERSGHIGRGGAGGPQRAPQTVCPRVVFFIFGTGRARLPGGGRGGGDQFQMFEMKIRRERSFTM